MSLSVVVRQSWSIESHAHESKSVCAFPMLCILQHHIPIKLIDKDAVRDMCIIIPTLVMNTNQEIRRRTRVARILVNSHRSSSTQPLELTDLAGTHE